MSLFASHIKTFLKMSSFALLLMCGGLAWGYNYFIWDNTKTDSTWETSNWLPQSDITGKFHNIDLSGDVYEITGEAAVTIQIPENTTIPHLFVNTKGNKQITIDTSSGNLTINNFVLHDASACINDSKVVLTGNGKITTEVFDFPSSGAHTFKIDSNATLEITKTLWANSNGTLTFTGDGYLYMPNGGANVNWGQTSINYTIPSDHRLPYPGQSTYSMSYTGTTFPITITLNNDGSKGDTSRVNFPYEVITNPTNTTIYELNSTAIKNGDNIYVNTASTLNFTGNSNSASFNLTCSSVPTTQGQGITVIVYSPDKFMEIGRISWYCNCPTWTGNGSDQKWTNSDNWSHPGIDPFDPKSMASFDVEISHQTKFPEIDSDISVKSLTITSGSKVTLNTNSTITTNKIETAGTGEFSSTNGTVELIKINSDNPTLTQAFSDKITINNLQLASGNFTIPPNLTIKNDITAKGGELTLPADFTVKGNLDIETGATLNSTNITLNKNFTNSGTITNTEITFDSSETQTFKSNTAFNYPSVISNKTNILKIEGTDFSADELTINTGSLELSSTAATINTSLKSSTVTNNGNLTCNGSFESLNFANAGTFSQATSQTVTVTNDLLNSGTWTASGNISAKNLENTNIWTDSGTITLTGNFINSKTFTKSGDISCEGSFTNTNTGAFAGTQNVSVKSDFSDSGTWTNSGIITLNGSSAQSFTAGTSTYPAITINKTTGDATFTNALKATDLTLTQAASTTFSESAQIGTFTDTPTAGPITFTKGASITNNVTFNTTETVTFGTEASHTTTIGTSPSYANLTHTAGNTIISGSLFANLSTFAALSTKGNVKLNTNAFFTENVASISNPKTDITITGTTKIAATKSITAKNITFENTVTPLGSTTIDAALVNFKGPVTAGNNTVYIINNTDTLLSNSFTAGTTNISGNLYLYGTSDITLNAGSNNIVITKNLYDYSTTGTTSFNSNVTAQNIILYNRPVKLAAAKELSAKKDLLIFGSTADNTKFNFSRFITRPANWTASNITPQANGTTVTLPSSASAPVTYGASIQAAANAVLKAGASGTGNLYANGTTLSSAEVTPAVWYISIPQNDTPATFCTEIINSSISDCTVKTTNGPSDGTKSQIPAENCTLTNCANFDSEDFEISQAYTVSDNRIFVKFNHELRNTNSEIQNNLINIKTSGTNSGCFTNAYSQAGGQNGTTSFSSGTTLYLYTDSQASGASNRWNTDATGTSAGYNDSTDSTEAHSSVIPSLTIPQFTGTCGYVITDKWGKRLVDYAASPFSAVEDKTKPLLVGVYTGQELHSDYNAATGEASQLPYDAHNFIEFRYSEPVNIGNSFPLPAAAVDLSQLDSSYVNKQTTSNFGGISHSGTETTIAEIGTFQTKFALKCGKNNSLDNNTTHSLYRYFATTASSSPMYQKCRLRIAIAGYVNGTISANGYTIKNWDSYIEESETPSGSFTPIVSSSLRSKITDNALTPNDFVQTSSVTVNSTESELYGKWDSSAPVFASNRVLGDDDNPQSWTNWADNYNNYEIVGTNNNAGTTINRIEFHLFDNTPAFSASDTAEWFSEIGWIRPNSTKSKANLYNGENYFATADYTGGARQFDSNSTRRTKGGIRYSTLALTSATNAFTYNWKDSTPDTSFTVSNFSTNISSPLFTGSATPMHSPAAMDSPYFTLGISENGIPLKTTFNIGYNGTTGFITDLAGNRMKSKQVKSVDRTAPSFSYILSPIGSNNLNIVFVKQLNTSKDDITLTKSDGTTISISENSFKEVLPKCFDIISINSSGTPALAADLYIDTTVPATIHSLKSNSNLTIVTLKLSRTVTFDDVTKYYVRLKQADGYTGNFKDPITNIDNCAVTFIRDNSGNYMTCYEAHAISDFAVSPVTPLYAYNSDITDSNDTQFLKNIYDSQTPSVRNFNKEQINDGSLFGKYEITFTTTLDLQTIESNIYKTDLGLRMFISDVPDSNSISQTFNSDYKTDIRVWFPDLPLLEFNSFAKFNNSNFKSIDGTLEKESSTKKEFNFVLTPQLKSNCQATFLFAFTDSTGDLFRIYNSPYLNAGTSSYDLGRTTHNPLFALRLLNTSDITTLDLWSVKLKDITLQRGGATILNNVININNDEKAVLKINTSQTDNINIIITTIDGNIVRYLHHGNLTAGEHFFDWDGTNASGTKVARGMYFVIIKGSGIDENRKIMVVK